MIPIVLQARSEISLESLFNAEFILPFHHQESLALFISGCPAMHLFELIIYSITKEDETALLSALKYCLYDEDWGYEDNKKVSAGQSCVHLYKLYSDHGMDSLKIIRHQV